MLPDVPSPSPAGISRSSDRDLFGEILPRVSRSFYLTLRVLPGPLRRPIALAYLLARASDTLADPPGLPAAIRLEALHRFAGALGDATLASPTLDSSGIADPAEQALLAHLPALFRRLHADPDRDEIVRVLRIIVEGQRLDLQRFPGDGSLRALKTAEELDDYTYRVAGCVGEFWTRLCQRHLRHYSRLSAEETIRLGIGFGKGLQWINILRDAPEDLRNGRCYFPLEELHAAGVEPECLLREPERARPLYHRWISQAREHLDAGRGYIEAIRPGRVRLACFLPWAIGMRTLDRLAATPPLEAPGRVKVPRREVYGILFSGWRLWLGNRVLEGYLKKGGQDGFPALQE